MKDGAIRIAYRKFECDVCGKPILVGHPYIPKHKPIGHVFKRVEIHPECEEAGDDS